MKKYIAIVAIALLACVMLACASCKEVEEVGSVEGVKMTAVIKSLNENIEVEVIEGEYGASGIYWVKLGTDATIVNQNGVRIAKSSLNVGDIIEITYSGQVMLSYPPQIVALQIQVK